MSLTFDGTNDVGTVDGSGPGVSENVTLGTTITVAAWFNASSQGEGNIGAVFNHTASARYALRWNGSAGSKKLRFVSGRATTNGLWDMTTGFTNVTGWKFAAVTYDGSLTTNDPIVYTVEDGVFATLTVGAGLTEATTPVGAQAADTDVFYIGNNAAGAQTWAGDIGVVSVWTRMLSEAEVRAVSVLGAMALAPDFHFPLDVFMSSAALQNVGHYAHILTDGKFLDRVTVSGATIAANPPMRTFGRRG